MAASNQDPRWAATFTAIEEIENYKHRFDSPTYSHTGYELAPDWRTKWATFSFYGLLFGPLYYFYKKMWQKGLVFLSLFIIILCLKRSVFFMSGKDFYYLNIIVSLLCARLANFDYYHFKKSNETMWPVFKFLSSPVKVVGGCGVIIFASVFAMGLAMPNRNLGASVSFHAATSRPAPSNHRVPDILPSEDLTPAIRDRLTSTCGKFVATKFSNDGEDVYGHQIKYLVRENELAFLDITNTFFNKHWAVAFAGTIESYKDGRIQDKEIIPYRYCVFGPHYEVISLAAAPEL